MTLILQPFNYSMCRKLASKRFTEAKLLNKKRLYSGAYYLGGYVIELALKACYCRNVKKGSFPPERGIYNKLYSHDLNNLLDVSGIKSNFNTEALTNNSLQTAWNIAKEWSEDTRYTIFKKDDSESLLNSVDIVFRWIQTKW